MFIEIVVANKIISTAIISELSKSAYEEDLLLQFVCFLFALASQKNNDIFLLHLNDLKYFLLFFDRAISLEK